MEKLTTIGGCVLLVLAACASTPPQARDASSQYELAQQLLDDGESDKAIVEFQKLLFNYPESVWADEAQMGLAESYFESGQYLLAEMAYKRVLELYPDNPVAPEADAMIGLTLLERTRKAELDQEMTWRARTHFERFLRSYPDHSSASKVREALVECLDRLAEKDYKNGRFYLKIGRPDAARPYFERILRDYRGTRWVAEALLGRAECNRHEGDLDAAIRDYRMVVEDHADTAAGRKARQKLERLESAS